MLNDELRIIYTLLIIKYVSGPKTDPLRESITKQEQWAFIECHWTLLRPKFITCNNILGVAKH